MTRWFDHPGARDHLFNHVRLGIKEERCIAAFSDQNQSTQRPKDYNIWANRGHPCFYKNEMALLVTILHTNPHLEGRSHPVSVEVREFDWDSSRKGASQLPRTKTIRLSTPKTTTGEILIFALTSPLTHCTSHHFTRAPAASKEPADPTLFIDVCQVTRTCTLWWHVTCVRRNSPELASQPAICGCSTHRSLNP